MLPTPSTSHVNYDRVYEPREDSFLLLDTLSSGSETSFLRHRFAKSPSPLVVEIGPGSGVVLAFVTNHTENIFGRRDVLTVGVDINAFACQATIATVRGVVAEQGDFLKTHGIFLDAANGDLTTCLRQKAVDVLAFNPPYMPSEVLPDPEKCAAYNDTSKETSFDEEEDLLRLSYAGGRDGMEVTNKLLGQLDDVLSERGVAYILLEHRNKPVEVVRSLMEWGPEWAVDVVGWSGKSTQKERLCIIRISRVI